MKLAPPVRVQKVEGVEATGPGPGPEDGLVTLNFLDQEGSWGRLQLRLREAALARDYLAAALQRLQDRR